MDELKRSHPYHVITYAWGVFYALPPEAGAGRIEAASAAELREALNPFGNASQTMPMRAVAA